MYASLRTVVNLDSEREKGQWEENQDTVGQFINASHVSLTRFMFTLG